MDLKDKLNLLWKYLFLVVLLVFGILLLTRPHVYHRGGPHQGYYRAPRGYMHLMGKGYIGKDHSKEIKVVKKVTNGDTTVVVWVGGKKVDNPEEYLKKIKGEGASGKHMEFIMQGEHGKKDKD